MLPEDMAQPQQQQGQAVDLNIAAILQQHQQQLNLLTQHHIPAYNRRYGSAAATANPIVLRPVDVEEALAEAYMGSLLDGTIQDRVFGAGQRSVTPKAAKTMVAEERQRHL